LGGFGPRPAAAGPGLPARGGLPADFLPGLPAADLAAGFFPGADVLALSGIQGGSLPPVPRFLAGGVMAAMVHRGTCTDRLASRNN